MQNDEDKPQRLLPFSPPPPQRSPDEERGSSGTGGGRSTGASSGASGHPRMFPPPVLARGLATPRAMPAPAGVALAASGVSTRQRAPTPDWIREAREALADSAQPWTLVQQRAALLSPPREEGREGGNREDDFLLPHHPHRRISAEDLRRISQLRLGQQPVLSGFHPAVPRREAPSSAAAFSPSAATLAARTPLVSPPRAMAGIGAVRPARINTSPDAVAAAGVGFAALGTEPFYDPSSPDQDRLPTEADAGSLPRWPLTLLNPATPLPESFHTPTARPSRMSIQMITMAGDFAAPIAIVMQQDREELYDPPTPRALAARLAEGREIQQEAHVRFLTLPAERSATYTLTKKRLIDKKNQLMRLGLLCAAHLDPYYIFSLPTTTDRGIRPPARSLGQHLQDMEEIFPTRLSRHEIDGAKAADLSDWVKPIDCIYQYMQDAEHVVRLAFEYLTKQDVSPSLPHVRRWPRRQEERCQVVEVGDDAQLHRADKLALRKAGYSVEGIQAELTAVKEGFLGKKLPALQACLVSAGNVGEWIIAVNTPPVTDPTSPQEYIDANPHYLRESEGYRHVLDWGRSIIFCYLHVLMLYERLSQQCPFSGSEDNIATRYNTRKVLICRLLGKGGDWKFCAQLAAYALRIYRQTAEKASLANDSFPLDRVIFLVDHPEVAMRESIREDLNDLLYTTPDDLYTRKPLQHLNAGHASAEEKERLPAHREAFNRVIIDEPDAESPHTHAEKMLLANPRFHVWGGAWEDYEAWVKAHAGTEAWGRLRREYETFLADWRKPGLFLPERVISNLRLYLRGLSFGKHHRAFVEYLISCLSDHADEWQGQEAAAAAGAGAAATGRRPLLVALEIKGVLMEAVYRFLNQEEGHISRGWRAPLLLNPTGSLAAHLQFLASQLTAGDIKARIPNRPINPGAKTPLSRPLAARAAPEPAAVVGRRPR